MGEGGGGEGGSIFPLPLNIFPLPLKRCPPLLTVIKDKCTPYFPLLNQIAPVFFSPLANLPKKKNTDIIANTSCCQGRITSTELSSNVILVKCLFTTTTSLNCFSIPWITMAGSMIHDTDTKLTTIDFSRNGTEGSRFSRISWLQTLGNQLTDHY